MDPPGRCASRPRAKAGKGPLHADRAARAIKAVQRYFEMRKRRRPVCQQSRGPFAPPLFPQQARRGRLSTRSVRRKLRQVPSWRRGPRSGHSAPHTPAAQLRDASAETMAPTWRQRPGGCLGHQVAEHERRFTTHLSTSRVKQAYDGGPFRGPDSEYDSRIRASNPAAAALSGQGGVGAAGRLTNDLGNVPTHCGGDVFVWGGKEGRVVEQVSNICGARHFWPVLGLRRSANAHDFLGDFLRFLMSILQGKSYAGARCPATLKSMSPRWSSSPRNVGEARRDRSALQDETHGNCQPSAALSGTPASINCERASTDRGHLRRRGPFDSVISETTAQAYTGIHGAQAGRDGIRAPTRALPWPDLSTTAGPPIRPVSPTKTAGKL